MITHFAGLQLNTVSKQGVKQFYHDKLGFPVSFETEDEIRFQPTEQFTLSFKEAFKPISPAHIAFEVPYSAFDADVGLLRTAGIPILKWPDGRETVDRFESGDNRNIYFRDGDGNLLELIAHSYVKEKVIAPSGPLNLLYLREVGMPVDDVTGFRERLKSVLQLKTGEESDIFNFVVGGTAHAIVSSTQRRWIPISMMALPPDMIVRFGVTVPSFIDRVRRAIPQKDIVSESDGELHFMMYGYRLALVLTDFDEDIPVRLNLPLSRGEAAE